MSATEDTIAPSESHRYNATVSFDGGDLDCGSGLLLLIRKNIDPLTPGQMMEVLSTETSVKEDLPSWCRLTKNELVSWTAANGQYSFLICKGAFDPACTTTEVPGALSTGGVKPMAQGAAKAREVKPISMNEPARATANVVEIGAVDQPLPRGQQTLLPEPAAVAKIAPYTVMGIGSWPRPNWLLKSLHEKLEGKISDLEFQEAADDAVRLAIAAQLRAGAGAITDGEQRRDNYASFVGGILANCQLVPLTDLLALVDEPDQFAKEMESLDVPLERVRHPVVFGRLERNRTLAVHEFEFARKQTDLPIKVALPGPYLLTRTMWLDCIKDRHYPSRQALAEDIVEILQAELHDLLGAGVALVQFDEPVLSEVVFGAPRKNRTFMCGALSERGEVDEELQFAAQLINKVVEHAPKERTAMHVCRGNWTPDESAALSGDYRPLLPLFHQLKVGTLFLEFCTPRAGDHSLLRELPQKMRIGLGVVNQKDPQVETVESIVKKAEEATALLGRNDLLLTPDCGFATFADNPLGSADICEKKLHAIAAASAHFK